MKALCCGYCGDIRGLQEDWVECKCGAVRARWVDPYTGTAQFTGQYPAAFVLGLNNRMLGPALHGRTAVFEEARRLHDVATEAPHHVFDKSRANCWAVIIKPGRSSDVEWVPPE